MRIISGTLRGRKLSSVRGIRTRPTTDRVREALFNILGTLAPETVVLDLFAGTGALGIEALSRGAERAVFVDRDSQPLAVLRKNIHHCGLQDRARVLRWDISKNLNCLKPYAYQFNLVFLDPPYHKTLVAPALTRLLRLQVLTERAIVVAEHAADESVQPPAGLICEDRRTYGQTSLSFFANTMTDAG